MHNSELNNLKSYLSQLHEEELIWVIFIYNKYHSNYNYTTRNNNSSTEEDIAYINSLDKLKNIINFIINEFNYKNDDYIYNFLRELKYFKSHIKIHYFDFKKIKNNERFLIFACNIMNNKIMEESTKNIKNLYFQFLYITYTFSQFYKDTISIEYIYSQFDTIYSKFNNHFKSQGSDFLIWAKNYINENHEFKRYRRDASNISEYEVLINSIFDIIYYENENIHYALRKKLSNAWYQKKHREENKVKKTHYYALTKKAREALHTLTFKYGMTEEQMIEKLINETFVKECCSHDGDNLYL